MRAQLRPRHRLEDRPVVLDVDVDGIVNVDSRRQLGKQSALIAGGSGGSGSGSRIWVARR